MGIPCKAQLPYLHNFTLRSHGLCPAMDWECQRLPPASAEADDDYNGFVDGSILYVYIHCIYMCIHMYIYYVHVSIYIYHWSWIDSVMIKFWWSPDKHVSNIGIWWQHFCGPEARKHLRSKSSNGQIPPVPSEVKLYSDHQLTIPGLYDYQSWFIWGTPN